MLTPARRFVRPLDNLSLFRFEGQAYVSTHRHANIDDRQAFAFETHGVASMGKIRVPGNVIVNAFVTDNVHDKLMRSQCVPQWCVRPRQRRDYLRIYPGFSQASYNAA